MATTYQTPGVYVEEVDKGTKPIEVLGSSMPAFVGLTAQASHKKPESGAPDLRPDKKVLGKATLVTNWTQFRTIFGSFKEGIHLPDMIYTYFNNGGGACYVVSLRALEERGTHAWQEINGIARGNATSGTGGGSAQGNSENTSSTNSTSKVTLKVKAKSPGTYGNGIKVKIAHEVSENNSRPKTFTMTIFTPTVSGEQPQIISGISIKNKKLWHTIKKNGKDIQEEVSFDAVDIEVKNANLPEESTDKNPFFQLANGGEEDNPEPLDTKDYVGEEAERTGIKGLAAHEEIRLLVCSDLIPDKEELTNDEERIILEVQSAMIAECERLKYRFAILDTPRGLNAQDARKWRRETTNFDSPYAALYYPWIRVPDFSDSGNKFKFIPPSGIMAGVYNRVDSERGVHKAPANEVLQGVTALERNLTKGEQDQLNPIGINCLRTFPGRGIRVWGARTLSSDGSWRYINVRRLFITIAASLDQGLQWVVFEPNDHTLWAKVRRDINAFLGVFWLNGALFGSTKGEAYYVKCDEELNPPEIRDLGQLIIEVGVSPVKPAEFVILRLSQWAGPNSESE